jgi:hypothetical protein
MFNSAVDFNQDIGSWDVRNVKDMLGMFDYATSFNKDLSGWCVENIKATPYFFAFNCDLQPEFYPVWGTCPSSVDISRNDYPDLLNISPNPTYAFLTIDTEIIDEYSIEVTSFNGRLLYTERMIGATHPLDLSSFRAGVYFITIRSNDYVTTRKIIKL